MTDRLAQGLDLTARFWRLVRAILDNRAVPFLGAGFSATARDPANPDFKPTVTTLQERAKQAIAEALDPKTGTGLRPEQPFLDHFNHLYQPDQKTKPSLGQLTEMAQSLYGSNLPVLQRMRIQEFAGLRPTAAHRYLAYLVREGLIDEVITTNYDCCIELAYRESFAADTPRSCPGSATAIHDLETYRQHAGRQRHLGQTHLKIYKINGCALEYKAELIQHGAKARPRILLTERELQDMGDEGWARDLLRDRARCRSLLFMGFGSEEPQVRHTVLALMEEFQRSELNWTPPWDELLIQPNAPFMVAREEHLTFPQYQIVSGYVQAHTLPGQPFWPHCMGNTFTAADCLGLDIKTNRATLDADPFMQRLFQAVFGRLLVRHTAPGGSFYYWLSSVVTEPEKWRSDLLEYYYPNLLEALLAGPGLRGWPPKPGLDPPDTDARKETKRLQTEQQRTLGRCRRLLEPYAQGCGQPGPMLLWHWLRHLRSTPDDRSHDYYLSLQDEPLLCPLFLLMVAAIGRSVYEGPDPAAADEPIRIRTLLGIGVEVSTPPVGSNRNRLRLVFAHEGRPLQAQMNAQDPPRYGSDEVTLYREGRIQVRISDQIANQPVERPPGGLLRIIDLPSLTRHDERGRTFHTGATDKNACHALTVGQFQRLPIHAWIQEAGQIDQMIKALPRAFAKHRNRSRIRGVRLQALHTSAPSEQGSRHVQRRKN